jgi:hypothetical protein
MQSYLARALQSEDILVKLGSRLYIPGGIYSGRGPSLAMDGFKFSLEPCGNVEQLERVFLEKHTGFVDDILVDTLGDESGAYGDIRGNKKVNALLEVVADAFDGLQEFVRYEDILNQSMFPYCDLNHRMTQIGNSNGGNDYNLSDFLDLGKVASEATKIIPPHLIAIGGQVYFLGDDGSSEPTITTEEGVMLCRLDSGCSILSDPATTPTARLKRKIQRQVRGKDTSEILRVQKRYCNGLMHRIRSHYDKGLMVSALGTSSYQPKVDINMVLPDFAIPIPKMKGQYVLFKQGVMSMSVMAEYGEDGYEFSVVKFRSESMHPLVYDYRYFGSDMTRGKERNVCIRGGTWDGPEVEELGAAEQVRRMLLIARETLFHGTNLTTTRDSNFAVAIASIGEAGSFNWHNIRDKRLIDQRVDDEFLAENDVLVIREAEDD